MHSSRCLSASNIVQERSQFDGKQSMTVFLSRYPRYYLQITREGTLLFSNQETKAEMLEEWEVVADFTKLIPLGSMGLP